MMKLLKNLTAIMMMGILLSISSPAQDSKGKRPAQSGKETDRVREEKKNKERDRDRDRDDKKKDERKKP